jgi:hypothetical protein
MRVNNPEKVLITAGLGDLISLERMMWSDYKRNIKQIYWATPREEICRQLLNANPEFAHVEHISVYNSWHPIGSFSSYEHLKIVVPDIPHDLDDWSISKRFLDFIFGDLEYEGSSFLKHQLADIKQFKLPKSYYVLQGDTPANPEYHRIDRKLRDDEWKFIIKRLESEDTYGVVVNSKDAYAPPKHKRIVDLSGKTTVPQSVEIVKKAIGYMGIDSWLSTFTSELFAPDKILIKSVNMHLYANRVCYYAPLKQFPFIVQQFCEPESPLAPLHKDVMNSVLIQKTVLYQSSIYNKGSVINVPAEIARLWASNDAAIIIEKQLPTEAKKLPEIPKMRTADRPKPKRRASLVPEVE